MNIQIFFRNSLLLSLCCIFTCSAKPPDVTEPGKSPIATTLFLADKVTFQVDTRNTTVAASGMFVAGEFSGPIGIPNWTFIPMCDLGSGIWQVSLVGIPPGTYQFKFVNGNAPAGWEFDGFGGPCTNPADNNNRWMNYPGGMHLEGPHCINTCDMWCAGFSDPGVSDTDPPVITQPTPADVTIECGDPLPLAVPLSADDGCDENATTATEPPTDDTSGLGPCGTGDIIRTWEVTDCSGNTTTTSQTITVVDTTPPNVLSTIPEDTIVVNCGGLPPALPLDLSDDCDPNVIGTGTTTGWLSNTPCNTGTMFREWTGQDCSGNAVFFSQIIIVQDTMAPTINVPIPADVTVECQNLPAADPLAASDNCAFTITSTGPPTEDNSGLNACGTGTIVRTWTVEDCDGNSVTASQTITLEDNTPPTFSTPVPADVTVECGNVPPANALDASDACDATVTTTGMPAEDASGIGACGTGTIVRTWEVSDCSGNTATATQTITVEDNTAPTFTQPVPGNLTLGCNDPLPPGQPLNASDDCDASVTASAAPIDDASGLGPCGTGTIVRTWEVSDCAGNTATATQIFTITDNQPPMISGGVPPNTTVQCGNLPIGLPLPASDNCDPTVALTNAPVDDTNVLNSCGLGNIVRTWTVSDCSGNLTTATQTITVIDNEPPIISSPTPPQFSVPCGSVPPGLPLSAADGCDPNVQATGMPADDLSALSGCGIGTIVRTWTVSDCAGNTASAQQTILVTDDVPPTIDDPVPTDVTVDCGNVPAANALDASDACDPTVAGTGLPVDDTSGLNACGTGTIVRTWTVSDCAGNTATASQNITVTDDVPPVFQNTPPANLSACVGNVPPMTDLDWTDNCGGSGASTGTEVSDGMTDPETLTRTWTATDACGNETTFTQTITVSESGMANVGPDLNVCGEGSVTLSAAGAGGAVSVLWTTSGDGVFSDETNTETDYTPGPNDIASGSVTLTFTPDTGSGNCTIDPDELTVTYSEEPMANAGADGTLTCTTTSVELNGAGMGGGTLAWLWTGPGITPTNEGEQNPTIDQPGTYVLTVTDTSSVANCTAVDTVEVFENVAAPTANAGTDMQLTCTATSVELNGSGSGSGSLEYLWTGPGITAANENLSNPTVSESGTYELVVTDFANGCTATDEVEVTLDSNVPTSDPGPDQTIDCLSSSVTLDGSNSSSGATISLQWFDPNGMLLGTDPTQSATVGGTYSLTVSDSSNGCEITSQVSVTVDTISPQAIAGNDGVLDCEILQIEIGDGGASGSFDYLWTGSGITTANENLPNPTIDQPGNYALVVTDPANGCTATDEVDISQNISSPTANAGTDQSLDCSSPNVTLDGSTSGSASGSLDYLWTGPGIDAMNETLPNPTVSQSGVYTLTVTDPVNSCTATDEVEVATDGNLPTALAGPDVDLTCADPQTTLDGSASTPSLDYAWTDAGGMLLGTDLTLPVGTPGTYTLTVTNLANGCSASDDVTVGIDTLAPTANAGADMQLTCTVSSVVLDGNGSGSGTLQWQWTGVGITAANENFQNPTVSESGIYELTVTDLSNGCTATDEVEVTLDGNLPSADAGPDQTLTCSVLSATLQGDGSGGSNLEFEWTGPGIMAANQNLQMPTVDEGGTYSLIVTDPATGCSSPAALVEVMLDTVLPTAVIVPPVPLDCQTLTTVLDGSGSSGSGSLTWQWTGPGITAANENLPNPTVTELGGYLLTVTDMANGCTATATSEVLDNSNFPEVAIVGPALLTCEVDTLLLAETANAGLPEITYQWSTVDGNFAQANLSTESVLLDAPGDYLLTVTNTANGCSSQESVIIDEDVEAPQITFDQAFELGCQSANVDLVATVTAGSTDLAYEWSGPGFSSMEIYPTVSESGGYTLMVTDLANGCDATASVEVTQADEIAGVEFSTVAPACLDDADGLLTVDTVLGAVPPYLYSVNGGAFDSAPIFPDLAPGSYTLTVQDSAGCEWSGDFTIQQGNTIFVELGDDESINLGDEVQLSPTVTGTADFYIWQNAATLTCDDCPTPIAQPTETTTYVLTVADTNGCEASDQLTIVVDPRTRIFAPNVFSPNGDGVNDQFTLFAGYQVVSIRRLLVFDRWGANIFENFNFEPNVPSEGWDGTHRGQEVVGGVYVWFAEVELVNGEVELIEGDVMLMR